MRYQLRYVRAQRTRSSPGAKHDDSPRERAHTNLLVRCVSRLPFVQVAHMHACCGFADRASLRRRSPLGAGPVAQWKSVRFTRGRSLVRSQPGPQASVQVTAFSGIRLPTSRQQRPRVSRRLSAVTVILRARRAHRPHDPVGIVEIRTGGQSRIYEPGRCGSHTPSCPTQDRRLQQASAPPARAAPMEPLQANFRAQQSLLQCQT
jgi:hypothetical protein